MTLAKALLALATALGIEALLGRLLPAALNYVDLILVLVAYYSIRGSQRSAMLVGCAGGLLHDAWFQAGLFGLDGFKKTLEGWAVGGLAGRLDLNHAPGRVVVGIVLSTGDQLLEFGAYRLLDLRTAPLDPAAMAIRAGTAGLLVALVFAIVDRVSGRADVRGARGRT